MPFMEQILTQLADFHFLRPEWFYALIPAVLLFLLLKARDGLASNWTRTIDAALLPYLIETSGEGVQRNPFYLLLIAWALIIIALAGPVWEKTPQPVHTKEDALIIVLDLSFSMYAVDIKPNRITRARQKLLDILQLREEGVTGLVVYAGDAHVVSPLTDDADTIASMVPSLSPDIMPIYGSAFAPALELALQMFSDGNVSNGRILLITDEIPDMASSRNVAQDSPSSFPLSILSIGTTEGAPIILPEIGSLKDAQGVIVIPRVDFAELQDLADAVGGRHAPMSVDNSDIDYLLAESPELGEEQFRQVERDFDVWHEQGPWLVLLILPLGALAFRRGWLWCLVLLLLSPTSQEIYAEENQAAEVSSVSQFWQDLWQTADQQGIAALQQGDAQTAAKVFKDPAWRGSANYLGGNYEQASEIFRNLDTADGQYNLGNALARQNQYAEAIAAYDKVLEADPDNEDAKFNKELLEKLMQEQQQKNQDQQQQDDQNSDSDENQQSDQQQSEGEQEDSEQQQSDQQQSDQEQQGEQQEQEQQQQEEQEADDADSEEQQGEEAEQHIAQQQPADAQESELDEEAKQALEQWLRRVPDDPGGLLRRKFEYQTQQRRQKGQGKFTDRDAVW